MKWTLIIANLLAAILFYVLGDMAAAVHRVHSYSTYHEFVEIGAVDEQKLKTLTVQGNPPTVGYDMVARLQQIGNAESNFRFLATLAAGACIFNAIAVFSLAKKYTIDLA